jgi:outer membrane protein assembly factor BamD
LVLLTASICSCSSSGSDITTDDPEKAFKIAKRKFDDKDYLDAIEDFSFIKIKFPGTKIADQVQFYLGESYYYRKEYILAAYEYETMLKNYPLSPLIPDTRYKLGLCYYELSPKYPLDQEYTQYAVNELRFFLEQYPTHKYAPDAERKLKELEGKIAYKFFRTGELYVKMDNYKAASIYFNTVYEEYVDSEWADDAMIGHIDALVSLKKFDEAKKVLERFNKLFPKSDLKSKANKLNAIIKESQPQ